MKGPNMFSSRLLSLAALASLCVALSAQTANAQAQDAKIVVANTVRIFNEMEESRALNVALQNELAKLKNESETRKTDIENLKRDLTKFKPDSAQYAETSNQILSKQIQYESWGRLTEADLARRQKQQMKSLYDKIVVAVNDVAKQRGYDVVVAQQNLEFPNLENPQVSVDAVKATINQHNMLFVNSKFDITAEVIATLDQRYKAAGGTPAPPNAPAPAGGTSLNPTGAGTSTGTGTGGTGAAAPSGTGR
jgi:Skp family chaperone for outer membrane proteins